MRTHDQRSSRLNVLGDNRIVELMKVNYRRGSRHRVAESHLGGKSGVKQSCTEVYRDTRDLIVGLDLGRCDLDFQAAFGKRSGARDHMCGDSAVARPPRSHEQDVHGRAVVP